GSADWRHFGRLAGFSNCKDKHRQPGGHYPFVRLIHASGEVYEKADEFLRDVEIQLKAARIEADRRREWLRKNNLYGKTDVAKTIDQLREDPKYQDDGNRIDLAYAVHALSHGVSEDEVRTAIATRDLTKKGTPERQADYIERTVQKAFQAVRGEKRGR